MAGATLPTPLYPVYSQRLSLRPADVTLIFATYAVAVLATLLVFGRLSDTVGRRPVCLIAVGFSAASALLFASGAALPALYAGRVLSGVSAGLVTGAATAYLSELGHPLLAAIANLGGLGAGSLLAGLVSTHLGAPLRLPYLVQAVLLVPALGVLALPETVARPGPWRNGVRVQRLGVPRAMRATFVGAAIAGSVGFALLGFVTALVSDVLIDGVGDRSRQTVGVVAFLCLATAAAVQPAVAVLGPRRGSLLGLALLPAGAVLVTLAIPASSLALLVAGVVVGGAAIGLTFRSGLAQVDQQAPDDRRAGVTSTYFTVMYGGLTVPVITAGILVTTTTLLSATVALTGFVTVLSIAAAAVLARRR